MDCSPDGRGFLFYSMYHAFDVDVAKEYGVDEAIMIANFQFWISHNATNRKNYYDGKFWTFNSYKALSLLFPYFSEKQIRRIVNSLVTNGILITGNYNDREYDNTTWYAFADEEKWLSEIPIAQLGMGPTQTGRGGAGKGRGAAQMGQPIPDTNSVINSDTLSPPVGGEPGQVNFIIVPSGSESEEKKKTPAKKEKKDPEQHWPALVKVWFDFYMDKKKEEPTFAPADSNHFKKVIQNLKKRAKGKGIEWTEQNACNNLTHFLQYAYKVEWISQNFLISNILKQFDKIIADARGTNQPTNNGKGQQPVDANSAFSKFNTLNSQPPTG